MQNLEEKVDMMLHNQDEIQRCITNIQNNEINILTVQRDLLKTQFEMQQDIRRLDKKIDDNYAKLDKKIDDNYAKLDKKIDDNYKKLDNKIDSNYEELSKKIDNNAKDTSEIFQEICRKLDQNRILKRKIAIL